MECCFIAILFLENTNKNSAKKSIKTGKIDCLRNTKFHFSGRLSLQKNNIIYCITFFLILQCFPAIFMKLFSVFLPYNLVSIHKKREYEKKA